ncbi:MAG: sugar phosphate isomerase/epimerase [Chloroflexi bacterium]|nr:sugar phosphate isomerase/epimerase [Chloroflexota bacterium]MYA92342.1 sugar phosphate isomerase/epimerase [Chloroflexota bacterium]MYH65732.1 sugar phosphate isomerase/epimerase [Chloroflexota bacterium]
MIELAISSWTVHGALGAPWYEPDADGRMVNRAESQPAELSLLDLPAFIADEGIKLLEICNFHLPSLEDSYLARLRANIEAAGVTLVNLLVDTGNLSAADNAIWRRDIEAAKRWQDIAVKLGARGVRLDCGTDAPSPAAIQRSCDSLRELADYGAGLGLHTSTENWRATSVESENLLQILDGVGRPLRLCVDFGNAAKTADKYATLRALLPRATSLHCKGIFNGNALDVAEFKQALALVRAADFRGHIALICDGTEDEWRKALALKDHVERELMRAS